VNGVAEPTCSSTLQSKDIIIMTTSTTAPREPLRHNESLSSNKRSDRVKSLIGEPLLLPGEDRAIYDQLLAELTDAVQPSDSLEELWVSEAVAKHWEVLRQRRHKRGFIAARRQAGLTSLLKPLLAYGGPLSTDDGAEIAGALAWKYTLGLEEAKKEVEELLQTANLSSEAVDGETMALHLDTLATFDHLIWAAENRRDACLREIEHHRAPFGQALRRAITAVKENNVRPIEPPAKQKKAA
jgi:hypothetical protein